MPYILVGTGPLSSVPIEQVAATATEAISAYASLKRWGGQSGSVSIIGPYGKIFTLDRLERLAGIERSGIVASDDIKIL